MKILLILLSLLLIAFVIIQVFAIKGQQNIETYAYKVNKKYNTFEIRSYEATLFTSVTLSTKGYKNSSSKGFSILAGYIFGKNDLSKNIAMTAPVQISQNKDNPVMAFSMPSKYDIDELPKPYDESVEIILNPEMRVAVMSFSGLSGKRKVTKLINKFKKLINSKGIDSGGEVTLALYDNPGTTLPFKRRNELWFDLKN